MPWAGAQHGQPAALCQALTIASGTAACYGPFVSSMMHNEFAAVCQNQQLVLGHRIYSLKQATSCGQR